MGRSRSSKHEKERLRILGLYQIMDTAPDAVLDSLTRLAAQICETPIALISLVDDRRQWFKSRVGLDVEETPRDIAFCSEAIHDEDLMIVKDALQDTRFRDNPLVVSEPRIRFYAGAPLQVDERNALGTLCVIDREPRVLSPSQLEALRTLRQAVVAQIELKRSLESLRLVGELVPLCAWCQSVKGNEGNWVPLHEYVTATRPVTHGMCPDCQQSFREELG